LEINSPVENWYKKVPPSTPSNASKRNLVEEEDFPDPLDEENLRDVLEQLGFVPRSEDRIFD